MNYTNIDISYENLNGFLKDSKASNSNSIDLNTSMPSIDIANITAKFNCFLEKGRGVVPRERKNYRLTEG